MANITVTYAQYQSHSGAYTASDTVTLQDTMAVLQGISPATMAQIAANNVDKINATDDFLVLTVAQYTALGNVAFDSSDYVIIADTGANIAAASATVLAQMVAKGVVAINPTDSTLTLTVAQYQAVSSISLDGDTTLTISDTGAHIATLSAIEIAGLPAAGVDTVEATDDLYAVSLAQYAALQTITLQGGESFSIKDSGANIAALSAVQIAALDTAGVTGLDASDDALALSIAQYAALGSMTLSAGDVVTLTDTAANIEALTAVEIGDLEADGFDVIDSTDDTLSLTFAQYSALGAVTLTDSDVVTVTLTGAQFTGLTAGDLTDMGTAHVDILDSSDDVVTLTIAKMDALVNADIALTAGDTVTLADTGANLAALDATALAALAGIGVDEINASDNAISLTVAQYNALGTVTIHSSDTVTLADTAANIEALSAVELADFDIVNATDDTLNLTVAQYQSGAGLTAGDTVTLVDTGANIAALSAVAFGNLDTNEVDALDASDDALTLSLAQYSALGSVTLTTGDDVTVTLTGAEFGALTASDFDQADDAFVDVLDVDGSGTDTAVSIDVNIADALASSVGLSIAAGDIVTISDTAANIQAISLTNLALLAGRGVDKIDASDDTVSIAADYVAALGGITFVAGDTVTLADTGAHIAALTATQLGGAGLDTINASDDVLALTAAQYQALGTATLTAGDTVTLADTGAAIGALTSVEIAALAGKEIDKIDASNNVLGLTVAQYQALGTVTLAGGDTVALKDTGANLAGLSAVQIAALAAAKVDMIDASDDVLSLNVAKFNALGTVALRSTDVVTISDTAANLAGLSFAALSTKGVDVIDASDNAMTLSVAQANALGAVALTAGDVVTLADTSIAIQGLAGASLTALGTKGVDVVDATDDTLTLSASQVAAVLSSALTLKTTDTVKLKDTGANLAALTSAQYTAMAGEFVDTVDASDNTLALSVAQYAGLGTVTLTAGDTVKLTDTGAALAALTSVQIAALAGKNIDQLDSTNDAITLSLAQFQALGAVTIATGDVITINGTSSGDTITGLSNDNVINGLAGADTLAGAGGNDTIVGGAGADGMTGGSGSDTVSYAGATAAVTVNLTTNTVSGGDAAGDTITGFENAAGGNAADSLTGNGSANVLTGNGGNDTLNGGNGADTLDGGTGNDTMVGGNGDDIYYVDSTTDVTTEGASAGTDTIRTTLTTFTLAANFENLVYLGTAAFTGNGNGDNNVITGNSGANKLNGLAGNDTLNGAGGADQLNGGDGNDTLKGASGKDTLTGGNNDDTFVFVATTDSVVGSSADVIADFNNTTQADSIDISGIDANSVTVGDQAFNYGGQSASTIANSITWSVVGTQTIIRGDVNGDTTADFEIRLTGSKVLTAGDFDL